MISSTPLKHPLPPQVIRPAAPAGQKAANTPHPVAGVRFGGSTPTPSLWERFKQGVARLWNTIISPFKSILSWFKTPEASPKASVTPGPAPSPSQNQDPSAKPTPPAASAEAQPAEARPAAPADPNRPSAIPPPAALPARPKAETLPIPGSLPVSASQPSKHKKSRKSSSIEPKLESPPVKSQVTPPQGNPPQPVQPTTVAQPMDSQRPHTPQQTSQPSQPTRPTTTDSPPISPPSPGIWARATSFLAGLRPQPSAQQRHQQALNALHEMIGEPETPPPAPSKQQTQKSSEPGAPTRSRPVATSSRPVAATASLARGIPVEALFGQDLTRIHFKQQSGNTCYLLSALDAIFHHPQGKQILEKIQITRTPDGYSVKFPGQPNAVSVKAQELATDKENLKLANGEPVNGVESNRLGVRILECAYSKLPPHPLEPDQVFGTYQCSTLALEKIFGRGDNQSGQITLENIVGKPQLIGAAEFPYEERKIQLQEYLRSMAANARAHRDFDILTIIPKNNGVHYNSIRLKSSTPDLITVADPYDNVKKVRQIHIDQLLEQYHIKGLRIYR